MFLQSPSPPPPHTKQSTSLSSASPSHIHPLLNHNLIPKHPTRAIPSHHITTTSTIHHHGEPARKQNHQFTTISMAKPYHFIAPNHLQASSSLQFQLQLTGNPTATFNHIKPRPIEPVLDSYAEPP
ncbi:hypothetical protein M0R45_009117 [Rubus argutus]|uniref:Uncharacterized protein n=1 Tax=Rubus argutus TaxID=59490 RepID=A0AAW1Y3X3_RUBAR